MSWHCLHPFKPTPNHTPVHLLSFGRLRLHSTLVHTSGYTGLRVAFKSHFFSPSTILNMLPRNKRKIPESDAFDDEARTPMGSPPRKRLRVTQQQKQALIDNLQLESTHFFLQNVRLEFSLSFTLVTERARGLRAHYALQAQDLRARIERRINRIPMALRKKTMGELLAKHQEAAKVEATMPSPFKKSTIPPRAAIPAQQIDKMAGRRLVSKTPRLPRRKT